MAFLRNVLRHTSMPALRRASVWCYIVANVVRLYWIRLRTRRPLLVAFRSGGLGDVLATAPSIAILRASHPEHHLIYCTRPEFSGIARLLAGVDQVLSVFQGDELGRAVSRHFETRCFSYKDENDAAGSSRHFVLEMGTSVGVTVPEHVSPSITVEAMRDEEFVEYFGTPIANRQLVAIHTGPSAPVREWPLSHWNAVATTMMQRADLLLIQIGSGHHFLHGDHALMVSATLKPQRPLSILASARLLKRCICLLGIDSGPLHLAAAVGTPVIGLFGPVNPAFRIPHGCTAVVAQPHVDCQYCHHQLPRGHWETNCPKEIACMHAITVAQVTTAASGLIERQTSHALGHPFNADYDPIIKAAETNF